MLPWLTEDPSELIAGVRDISLAKLVRDDMLAHDPARRPAARPAHQRARRRRAPAASRACRCARRCASSRAPGWSWRASTPACSCASPMPKEVRDLYEMRGVLDGYAGRRAARPADAAARVALADAARCLDRRHERAPSPRTTCSATTARTSHFHWAIVEAAGNHALADTYRGIVQKLHLSRLKNLSHDIGMRASIVEHGRSPRAVRKGDVARCERPDGAPRQRRLRATAGLTTAAPSNR